MAKENEHTITKEIFVTSRSFDAPLSLVFAAFTDPEHLIRWWGPKAFSIVYCKRDLRPGGMVHYCARSPEGKAVWGRFAYRKIIEGRCIIFANTFSDEDMPFPGWPQQTIHQVAFTEQEGKTTIILSSEATYNESFDQLENYLATICRPMPLNKIA